MYLPKNIERLKYLTCCIFSNKYKSGRNNQIRNNSLFLIFNETYLCNLN